MAVVIRLKRMGRRNAPFYRISVADKSAPPDGRTLANLGVYDPTSPVAELREKVDVEAARHWITNGARPSETVASILGRAGVYETLPARRKQRDRSGRKKVTKTRERRRASHRARAERKDARRTERVAAKRAAKQAAGAGTESSS